MALTSTTILKKCDVETITGWQNATSWNPIWNCSTHLYYVIFRDEDHLCRLSVQVKLLLDLPEQVRFYVLSDTSKCLWSLFFDYHLYITYTCASCSHVHHVHLCIVYTCTSRTPVHHIHLYLTHTLLCHCLETYFNIFLYTPHVHFFIILYCLLMLIGCIECGINAHGNVLGLCTR